MGLLLSRYYLNYKDKWNSKNGQDQSDVNLFAINAVNYNNDQDCNRISQNDQAYNEQKDDHIQKRNVEQMTENQENNYQDFQNVNFEQIKEQNFLGKEMQLNVNQDNIINQQQNQIQDEFQQQEEIKDIFEQFNKNYFNCSYIQSLVGLEVDEKELEKHKQCIEIKECQFCFQQFPLCQFKSHVLQEHEQFICLNCGLIDKQITNQNHRLRCFQYYQFGFDDAKIQELDSKESKF